MGVDGAATFGHAPGDLPPYAYGLVERLASELPTAEYDFADSAVPSPDEQTRGQLLRHWPVTPSDVRWNGGSASFCRSRTVIGLAAFRPETAGGTQYRRFVSIEGQVLNQRPEFVDY